jgi:ABC-type uncharacterized transport system auxiliary subunit
VRRGAARPSQYYELTIGCDVVPAANPTLYPVTLLLGRITSSELYRDGQIVYTSTGQAMGTYEYHRWAEPPSEMINDILLRELQMSGHYQNVCYPSLLVQTLFKESDKCCETQSQREMLSRFPWSS